ncbi:MAG: POTRA domain-containing protein, partial [Rhodospirillales bacterium]
MGLSPSAAAGQGGNATIELAQNVGTIQEIVVEGTQRIEPDTVRSYLLIREGDPFDPAQIDKSLKSLFATGLFADVTLGRKGDALVVTVVENPVINRIAFEGNKKIDTTDLEAEVALRPRVIYTRTKVQNDVKRILSIYRRSGRFAATVEPKVIQLAQNRVDLVFEINEGELTE